MLQRLTVSIIICLLAIAANAERKVSKIYRYSNEEGYPPSLEEVQILEYDNAGRMKCWKEGNEDGTKFWFIHNFNYVDDRHITITGLSDGINCRMDVILNNDGLVESAALYEELRGELKLESTISPTYKDGLMTAITWVNTEHNFTIINDNPTGGIRNDHNEVAYTDLPNKCGMAYLPFITCNTAWRYRSLALAGLQGYGSRNLPYSCQFALYRPVGVIAYEFDEEGYVLSMNITNSYDGDGLFKFEYCEVAGIDDAAADTTTVNVRSENGDVIVDGPYSAVSVYDLTGSPRGLTGLAPGLYIVTVDGVSHKLLVR